MLVRIGLVCIVLSAVQAFATTNITPTTTLSAETANNTSGADSFKTQSNGNIAPSNVSKVLTSTVLYRGSTSAVYAHFMPWFGVSYHMNVGYNSADPAQVKAQVSDMISRGIAGVIIDWYGPNANQENASTLAMAKEAASRNGAFKFAIMEDSGAISSCANQPGCDLTAALINDLNYISQTFAVSPAYITWKGSPVVFYFGVEAYGIDWTRVRANTASNLIFVFQNAGGFTRSYSNAGFSWVQPADATISDPMSLNYLNDFYSTAQQYPAKLPVGASYKGFDDTLAGWTANRHIQQQCGQTWLSTFNKANSMWSSVNQLAWFQLVTWNDYEEGTEIETGIDNCLSISASVSGSALTWSISGNENTIDHYTAFISADGQNLMPLGDFAPGIRSVDLASFGFNAGMYSVFVKAVGKPSIVNHMSAAATYTSSPAPPLVVLDVTPTSGIAPIAVSASTARSTDSSRAIVSSSIDFGDSFVVSGSAATHTYANAGTYTIKAVVTNSAGISASQSAQISVQQAQPPVARLSVTPASGTAPVAVTASTASSTDPQTSPLTSTIDFGDGAIASGPTATHTYSNSGTFTVKATVTDALSLQSQATATVNVTAPAAVNVSQPVNNTTVSSPIHVVANGSAPSGVDAMQIYLDGALVYQVNAGSFDTTVAANAGTHLVVVKLWDKLGNAYSQSLNVSVSAPASVNVTLPVNNSIVPGPVHVIASGSAANGVDAMQVYLDGALVYQVNAASFDTTVPASSGTHLVVVKLWDKLGSAYKQSLNVTVQ